MHKFSWGVVTALLLAAAAPLEAGTVRGRVTAADGIPLADVRIEVVEVHRHATTDEQGRYRIASLPAGVYRITFSLIGYRPVVQRVTVGEGDVELNVQLTPSMVELATIQVTASAVATDALSSPQPLSILDTEMLRVALQPSLGATLELQPGVRNASTGVGIGKPVIRGLSSNRVLVVADGQRLETQQWGDEHGPNIETADAERVEIIRGPASVLYGSDALGGVINVVKAPLPDAIGRAGFVRGSLAAGYATNGRAPDGVLTVEGADGPLGFRGALTGRTIGDTRTPGGRLGNSGFDAWGGSLALGSRGSWGSAALEYDGRKERIEIHEDPGEDPDATPFQRVADDRVRGTLALPLDGGARLELDAGFQRNNRREFEAADDPELALGLLSRTGTGDVRLHHTLGRFAGILGVSGLVNDATKSGEETLVPSSSHNSLGLYAFEQTEAGRWNLSFGARFEYRHLDVEEDDDLGVEAQSRSWSALTGSLGALYRVSDQVALVSNLGSGFRAPSTFELFANGEHPGSNRFERGDPTLKNETSLNADLAVRVQSSRVRAELGGFVNRVQNYIYPNPTAGFDPESGLQIFDIVQGNAVLGGFEAAAEYHPGEHVHLRSTADYVVGQNTTADQPLAFIPPFRVALGVRLEGTDRGALHAPYVDLSTETYARQGRPDPDEFAPDGYTLVHLGAGVAVPVGGSELHLDLTVRNLFDTAYASFLSRYKRYALDPGRSLALRASVRF